MSARSNHRYDTADYGSLDAFLGNMDDFHKLKQEMDKRGMHSARIIGRTGSRSRIRRPRIVWEINMCIMTGRGLTA